MRPVKPTVPRYQLGLAPRFFTAWSMAAAHAPFGSIREDGLRVRAATGTTPSATRARAGQVPGCNPSSSAAPSSTPTYPGDTTNSRLPETTKVLGGLTAAHHTADHPQATSSTEMGAKRCWRPGVTS